MARSEAQIYGRLRLFNLAMGTLHLLQGGAMLLLSNDSTLPLRTTFLDSDPQSEEILTLTNTVFDLRLGPLVAVFLLISAAARSPISRLAQPMRSRASPRVIQSVAIANASSDDLIPCPAWRPPCRASYLRPGR